MMLRIFSVAASLLFALSLSSAGRADTVALTPTKDNTLIEPIDQPMSNALGDGIYSGRTALLSSFTLRRAVLAFDVAAAIPPGSVIESVTLDLYLILSGTGTAQTHTLHRLLADWGEGTSSHPGGIGSPATDGDATWDHTFFSDQFWTNPGGDFVAGPSASLLVPSTQGIYTWGSTPEMVADVQTWLDEPESNFGWVLLGNEMDIGTARKFASRENSITQHWPRLHIQFASPCAGPADLNCDGSVGVADLLILLSQWGPCADCTPGNCPADLTGDCNVGVSDLLFLLANWG